MIIKTNAMLAGDVIITASIVKYWPETITHQTIDCTSRRTVVAARKRTPGDGGNRWPASAVAVAADIRPSPVPTPRASAAAVPCGDEGPRAAATCDGDAAPVPPGPSPRPNGSRPTASRSTLRTLWTYTKNRVLMKYNFIILLCVILLRCENVN